MVTSLFTESRGSGPDLVVLHGWGLNSGVWQPIDHALQQRYKVTYIDLPGYGRNAGLSPEPYTLETVCELIASHVPAKALLLGWSLGGLIATQIASHSRANPAGLILVASSPRFSKSGDWPGMQPHVLRMFESQLQRDFSKTLDRFLAIQALGSLSAKDDIKTIRRHIAQYPVPSHYALHAGLKILADTDLRNELAHLSIPVLQLFGRLDSLVPPAVAQGCTLAHCNSAQQVIEHAAHAPFISHPDEFLAALDDWQNRL